MQNNDLTIEDLISKQTKGIGNPPIDGNTLLTMAQVSYGFGNLNDPIYDPLQIRILLHDARKNQDGKNLINELFILKDSKYSKLPDAYQFPDGSICFFAYESQLSSILSIIYNTTTLWLIAKDGRMNITPEIRHYKTT